MRSKFGPLKNINKNNLQKLTDGPGVYGLYTKRNKLLKVGRAKKNRPSERIVENLKKIKEAKKFSFIKTPTVDKAKKLETTLIKKRRPPLNKERKGK